MNIDFITALDVWFKCLKAKLTNSDEPPIVPADLNDEVYRFIKYINTRYYKGFASGFNIRPFYSSYHDMYIWFNYGFGKAVLEEECALTLYSQCRTTLIDHKHCVFTPLFTTRVGECVREAACDIYNFCPDITTSSVFITIGFMMGAEAPHPERDEELRRLKMASYTVPDSEPASVVATAVEHIPKYRFMEKSRRSFKGKSLKREKTANSELNRRDKGINNFMNGHKPKKFARQNIRQQLVRDAVEA